MTYDYDDDYLDDEELEDEEEKAEGFQNRNPSVEEIVTGTGRRKQKPLPRQKPRELTDEEELAKAQEEDDRWRAEEALQKAKGEQDARILPDMKKFQPDRDWDLDKLNQTDDEGRGRYDISYAYEADDLKTPLNESTLRTTMKLIRGGELAEDVLNGLLYDYTIDEAHLYIAEAQKRNSLDYQNDRVNFLKLSDDERRTLKLLQKAEPAKRWTATKIYNQRKTKINRR